MSSFGGTIHRDELLWLLGSLSGLYRLPFDAALVAQSFPPPYDRAVLHEAARSLGFKTGTRATEGLDWQKLPLPAVGFLLPPPETSPPPAPDSPATDPTAAEATDPPAHTLLIILKIEVDKLLYYGTRTAIAKRRLFAPSLWQGVFGVLQEGHKIFCNDCCRSQSPISSPLPRRFCACRRWRPTLWDGGY